jgi:MFS family permease
MNAHPLKLARRAAASFSPAAMPLMSRRAYRWEFTAAAFLPASLACVDGNMVGVIAEKAFAAPAVVIATLGAATPLANITSALWTKALHGTHRVHAIMVIQAALLACVALIMCSPVSDLGLVTLVAGVFLGRVCMTGIMNARSDVWRANYPRTDRARITGKLAAANALIIGASSLTVGLLMDRENASPTDYRIFYAIAIAAGLVGIWCFAHIRWRGGPQHRRIEREKKANSGTGVSTKDMIAVLKRDRLYRRYMVAQFILGMSNLAAMPLFIVALGEFFTLPYTPSLLLTHIIPITMPILSIPVWAKLLDRTHIIRFRVVHSWFFVAANLLLAVGFLTNTIAVIAAARVILGIAFGGGMLAWTLGHHDFASREMASIYMGIHATLTGVRGAIAPYLGTVVYAPFAVSIGGASIEWQGLGAWTFLVLAGVGTVGAALFVRLFFIQRAQNRTDATPDHPPR